MLTHAKTKTVRAILIPDASSKSLIRCIQENVSKNSIIYTDEWRTSLTTLGYKHKCVHHKKKRYVNGTATTNGAENFHSRLRPLLKGVYRTIPKKSLPLFLNEALFRYNIKDYNKRITLILDVLLAPKLRE
ncbi:MAG: transposase [Brevinema sp.]